MFWRSSEMVPSRSEVDDNRVDGVVGDDVVDESMFRGGTIFAAIWETLVLVPGWVGNTTLEYIHFAYSTSCGGLPLVGTGDVGISHCKALGCAAAMAECINDRADL